MAPSIDWSLRKVFVKEDLDLTVHSGEAFLSWRRQFNNFVREAGIKAAAIPWESQLAALEACVTTTTFSKIQAVRSQLPADQRKNLDALLEATATLAQAADNVWLHRHAFDAYRQLPDQTFKQFYAEIVKLASLCQFDKDFCDADKIRVVDQLLLMKIVFGSTDISAQRKLIEETDLTLASAIRIMETYESLQKTADIFTETTGPTVQYVKRTKSQTLDSKTQSAPSPPTYLKPTRPTVRICRRCGYNHSPDNRCPAEGKYCNFCHGIGHFERVCFKKLRQSKPTTNLITSDTVEPALESGAVVSQIGTKTETVLVHVSINKCTCKVMRFIVDTGSDWCVIGPQNLRELGLTPSCLQTPTTEVCNTVTATGEQMLPDGYIDARFSYGCKQADSKLVVFKNIEAPLLSVDVLQQLKIVVIHLTESSVSPSEQAHISLNRASLSDSSILLPFDPDHVFLNTELHCCSSITNDAELLRQHLLEEFHDVFE